MRDKQEIILSHFRDGESTREISRRLGSSRGTVRKYIEQYSRAKETLLNEKGAACGELIERIVEAPRYDRSTRTQRKLTTAIVERVKECLEEHGKKRSRGQHKPPMKKSDMSELLQREGDDSGYGSLCNVVTE